MIVTVIQHMLKKQVLSIRDQLMLKWVFIILIHR
nr:MAG TPA: hypothetical protein [Bacteriophage sp.]